MCAYRLWRLPTFAGFEVNEKYLAKSNILFRNISITGVALLWRLPRELGMRHTQLSGMFYRLMIAAHLFESVSVCQDGWNRQLSERCAQTAKADACESEYPGSLSRVHVTTTNQMHILFRQGNTSLNQFMVNPLLKSCFVRTKYVCYSLKSIWREVSEYII